MPDLAKEEGRKAVDELLDDETRLIIIDSLSTFIRTGDENAAEAWIPIQNGYVVAEALPVGVVGAGRAFLLASLSLRGGPPPDR